MKKAINKWTLMTIGLVTFSSIGLAQIPLAQNTNQPSIEFKFIGNVSNQPMFRLNVDNNDKDGYRVDVKDEYNDVLYSEVIKGSTISRRYQIDLNDAFISDDFKVTFEITSRKTHKTTIYNITKKQHVVNDIMIAQL